MIEGASNGTAKLVGDKHKLQLQGIVAIDRRADLVLLKAISPAPPLLLGPLAGPVVGDDVYVVVNPLGLEGTFSQGIISGLRTVGSDLILQMTAPIFPGSSGGPVMDSSGTVVGIAVATFKDGQNINLAVPVDYLKRLLLQTSKMPSSLNTNIKDSDSKSIASFIGTKVELGVNTSNSECRKPANIASE